MRLKFEQILVGFFILDARLVPRIDHLVDIGKARGGCVVARALVLLVLFHTLR